MHHKIIKTFKILSKVIDDSEKTAFARIVSEGVLFFHTKKMMVQTITERIALAIGIISCK